MRWLLGARSLRAQLTLARLPSTVLTLLDDPLEAIEAAALANGTKGCAFCGGLGHRITDCPKLATYKSQQLSTVSRKDYLGGGGFGGET